MSTAHDALGGASALVARAGADTTAANYNTIGQYAIGLNGVNQPMNMLFKDVLWWSLGIMAIIILGIRIIEIFWAQIRLVANLGSNGDNQTYWKITQWSWMPGLKRRLMYAPLGHKRHNREFRLSSAMHMGTLPSRLHSIIIAFYVLTNLIYMVVLNWNNENRFSFVAELRGRSGTLSVVNMVPLIMFAGRNNPLIPMLKISFDTYNLLHRWLGRLSALEAIIHTICWAYVQVNAEGWGSIFRVVGGHAFQGSGMVGTFAMIMLFFLSLSPVRHAFYETFLASHIVLALIIFVCTLIHCVVAEIPGGLPQISWMIGIFALWFIDRLARVYRLAYHNWSTRGFTEVTIEAMPADCTRMTFHLPRYVDVKPGTHCYIRLNDIAFWENHPFSVAWVEHVNSSDALPVSEKTAMGRVIDKNSAVTNVSFLVGAQTGWTRKLYNKALEGHDKPLRLKGAMEGPYAGHHSIDSYGHAVLFAGATGITHQLSYLRHLVNGYTNGLIATRRVTLVWIIRDFESLEWCRPWMDQVLQMPRRKEILRIQIYVTRPKNPSQIVSPSDTVQMFPGRPNTQLILQREAEEQIGSMYVSVCGSGALSDDIRQAVRDVQSPDSVVDFVEESFSW
jgi:hypothetical protein